MSRNTITRATHPDLKFGDRDPRDPAARFFTNFARDGVARWRTDAAHARQIARSRAWVAATALTIEGLARSLHQAAYARARRRGIAFGITIADVMAAIPADMRCPVFGFRHEKHGRCAFTIDRILNYHGYIPHNIQVVSLSYNSCKNAATCGDDILAYTSHDRLSREQHIAAAAHFDAARARALAAINPAA